MPEKEMKRAESEARNCDLFLVLGSSLVVYPAAGLPLLAKQDGAKLIIINREPTPLDGKADLTLEGEIGSVLPAAVAEVVAAKPRRKPG
jgi:NAD-dependent deacetylase